MRTWVLGVVLVAACKAKSGAPASQGSGTNAVVASDAAAGAIGMAAGSATSTVKRAPKKPPTKAQLAEYKKRMKAGWALQKQKKWSDAVPEFEAALEAIDSDERATTELGWSAMNAGDYVKARKADLVAVNIAIDPKVKAAALYNLGSVLEKVGDKDGALKTYLASLQLRPNKIVEQAVGRLGATPETIPPLCKPGQKPCECVLAAAFGEPDPDDPATCEPQADPKIPVPGFKEYLVKQGSWSWNYLLDERQELVAIVGGGLDRLNTAETITLEKAELRNIGGHSVLWIQTKDAANQEHPTGEGDTIASTEDTTVAVTICVVGDAKTPTKCPVRDVPLSREYTTDRLYFNDEDEAADKGFKPTHSETKTDVAIADDGTVTVKLASGPSDEALDKMLGPHKLW
ncbi:MAG TPA: tetratricopeptide repeat protein [Kofleriaceae bacterium]|nr:tetratricopeptide repeat protein [Kofleriaceae bacterium]